MCDGRVRGTCTDACMAIMPSRARRSRLGVATVVLPYAPSRSARSVSMVISTRFRAAGGTGGRLGAHATHADSVVTSHTQTRERRRVMAVQDRRRVRRAFQL